MGKGSKRRRSAPRSTSKGRARDEEIFSDKELDDEIDAFHKQREMIPLDITKDSAYSDDDSEEPVFDLEGCENDDNESGGEASHDEDEDGYDDFVKSKDKGFTAKIARQAKYLKEKFGGEDDLSDDDEEDKESKAVWGRQKNLYYSADNVDYELQSSDEDLPMEEEAEVLKIQQEKAKSLLMEDYGLESPDQEQSDSDERERTFQEMASEKAIGKPAVDASFRDDVTLYGHEEIKKDLNDLSKEEQMDVVYSSAPELINLLSELNMALGQLEEVKAAASKVGKEGTDKIRGMDYFKVKQVLLLSYCQAISFYLLLKSEGHPVRDHPVIARLIEIRNLLEKMKHIHFKFPLQVEDDINKNLDSKKCGGEKVPMELETGLMDVTTNSLVAPEGSGSVKDVIHDKDPPHFLKSAEMIKLRENLEAKLKQKGIYNFIKEKSDNVQKDLAKSLNRNLETTNDYDDEIRPSHAWNVEDKFQPRLNRIAQAVMVKTNGRKSQIVSGDVDLPKRDDIAARRRKYELRVLARAGVTSMEGDHEDIEVPIADNVHTDILEKDLESEDEFYQKVKKHRAEKLKSKSELHSRPHNITIEEPEPDGKRHISVQMEKNRGLTRNRKKLTKNPRKKYKIKHQKAVIRRKGQVRDIRKPSGPYGGEATGINVNVSRSIRFKN
ncbi:hypothetical protein HPP92_014095 [Vanilla planifolia]|uniref:Sas10 C-terminal domain-containing protein n=1 Tax=Vanilla planifolia TaxID=51239 RepID=A0A835QKQ9_VANPL|nr:hypothetical protein HPP92_014095 [Vanilla planifolia]